MKMTESATPSQRWTKMSRRLASAAGREAAVPISCLSPATELRVRGACRGGEAVRARPVGVLRREFRLDRGGRFVGGSSFGLQRAGARLHALHDASIRRDDRPGPDFAVSRHDRPRLEGLERVECGQPRLHARHGGRRHERVVHHDVAGKQDAVALDEEGGVAARMRRTDDHEPHPDIAEVERVGAIERDGGGAADGVLEDFGGQRPSGRRTSAPSASRSARTRLPGPSS